MGIAKDTGKLLVELGTEGGEGNAVNQGGLAGKELKNEGLKMLTEEMLGKEVEKLTKVPRSRWERP